MLTGERMALYRFACPNCGTEFERILPDWREVECPGCGASVPPQLPKTASAIVYDTKDPYRGKKQKKNLDKQMKRRLKEHHARYDAVKEIDQYGLQDAERNGVLKKVKKV